MSEDFIPEDSWDDEEPEDDLVEADGELAIRFQMVTNKKQEPLRIDKFLMVRLVGATRNKVQQALD
jgi:23S rRNA pseudouridine1911/1915/1917 synthase